MSGRNGIQGPQVTAGDITRKPTDDRGQDSSLKAARGRTGTGSFSISRPVVTLTDVAQ